MLTACPGSSHEHAVPSSRDEQTSLKSIAETHTCRLLQVRRNGRPFQYGPQYDLVWPAILAEARARREPLAAIAAKHGVAERTISYRLAKERKAAAALRDAPDVPQDDTPATPEQSPPHLRRPVDCSRVRWRFTWCCTVRYMPPSPFHLSMIIRIGRCRKAPCAEVPFQPARVRRPCTEHSPCQHTQPGAAAADCDPDEAGDVHVSDSHAGPASPEAAAAALRVTVALQKRARLKLAQAADSSRAVPQHAVALLASLWKADTADLSGTAVSGSGNPADAIRRRVAAACWGYHAEQRGCARAVSRADVTFLVGLLKPAGWGVERPQVSLCNNCH